MGHHHYDTLFKKDPAIERWAQFRAFETHKYWKPSPAGFAIALFAYVAVPVLLYKVAKNDVVRLLLTMSVFIMFGKRCK